jgi:signal transduction histidine kinase/CheY-like chemotaxis protein/HPt (histidine-containing phosphotransfer) domain-containing protein
MSASADIDSDHVACQWFDAVGEPLFLLSPSGALLRANAAGAVLLGYERPEQLVSHAHVFEEILDQEELVRISGELHAALRSGRRVFSLNLPGAPCVMRENGFRSVEVVATPTSTEEQAPALLCLCRDVSAKMLLAERVRQMNELHVSLLEAAPLDEQLQRFVDQVRNIFGLGFAGVWLQGRVSNLEAVGAIRYAERLFLVSSSGAHLDSDNPLREPERLNSLLGKVASGETSEGACSAAEAVKSGAELAWVVACGFQSFYAFRLAWDNGENAGVLGLFSAKEFCEEERPLFQSLAGLGSRILQLGQAQDKALRAKAQAEITYESKNRFMASMSHEMRTPLNAIVGLIDMARKADSMPKVLEYLASVQLASESLRRIIDDVLDYSRIEAGGMKILNAPFQLLDVIESLTDLFSEKAGAKGLDFVVAFDPCCPSALIGDKTRLQQILVNLVENAIKFTSAGEVRVEIECLGVTRDRAAFVFRVIDTGIGFPPEKSEALFTPFYQGRADISRTYGGTGLGLAICRRLVGLMFGEIRAESQVGKGSVFHLTLGLQRRPADEPDLRLPDSLAGKKILALERNPVAARALERLCREALGVEVHMASRGREALDLLRREGRTEAPYDLVLFSEGLEDMSGIEFLEMLQRDTSLFSPPMLVVLPLNYEARARLEAAGACAVLAKPIKPRRLKSALLAALAPKEIDADHVLEPDRCADNVLRGARILVVEDNAVNRLMVIDMLRYSDALVDAAEDGVMALELLEANHPVPGYDAVLMDIQMPRMDGYETTKMMRRDPRFVDIPVIAVTAYAMSGDRELCLAGGMNDYLSKPLDLDLLLKTLAKWVKPAPRQSVRRPSARRKCEAPAFVSPLPPPPFLVSDAFDVEDAMKRLKGNADLYRRMLQGFLEELALGRLPIRDAVSVGDRELAIRLAHTLKGTAGNMSAMRLKDAASQALAALRSGETEGLDELIGALELALDEAKNAAPALLALLATAAEPTRSP